LTAVDIQKTLLLIFGAMVCFFVVTNVIVSKHFMDGSARERVGPQIKSLRVQSPSVLLELPKGEVVALPLLLVQENANRQALGLFMEEKEMPNTWEGSLILICMEYVPLFGST